MLEIAKDLGVDKQKVYRCIKKNDIKYTMKNDIMYFDEAEQTRIKSELFADTTISKNSGDTVQKHFEEVDETVSEVVSERLNTIIMILQRGLEIIENQFQEKDREIERLKKFMDEKERDSQP